MDTFTNSAGRELLSLSQYTSSVGAFAGELLYGQLFWLLILTLLCLCVMGILALVSRCHPNENMKKLVRLRPVYMLLRIALFAYLPLAVTASYSLTLGSLGPIVVGAIVMVLTPLLAVPHSLTHSPTPSHALARLILSHSALPCLSFLTLCTLLGCSGCLSCMAVILITS